MRPISSTTRRQFLGTSVTLGVGLAGWGSQPRGLLAAPAAAEGGYTIGCYTRPWSAFDYRAALDDIASAGYKHAGLMTTNTKSHLVLSVDSTLEEAQQVGEECRKRGLAVPSLYGGDFRVARSLEAGIAGLRHLIDVSVAAGAATLLLGGTSEKLYEPYFQAVAACCDYAAEKQVGLTLKPHGGINATGPQLRKAAERVGKKNFTLWYDAGNIFFYSDGKLNPVDDAPSVDGFVSGWCVKDFTLTPKKDVMLTPGTGQVDFKAVFARLKQGGFGHGPLVVETLAPGDRPALLSEAIKARKFLEELVRGV